MDNLARYLIVGGLILVLVGVGLYLASRLGLPLGRLPGDIRVERGGSTFYFPLATSLLLSIILTVLLNVILRAFRR
ncbi:MAG TPA: DUF2905 domain-containing protein [Anaerolineales bacterium]|nr:DUF2905 domain-containing protein [Anaerolineales bacterium]